MLTRVLKSGHSLAVRIPKELGSVDTAQDVEVERVGDTLVLRLVAQETLADIGKIFGMFSPGFMADGREFHGQQDDHALSLLIGRIPVLPFTESDAKRYGVLRAAVRDRSRNAVNRLVAGHAVNAGLTLVTNNEADFKDYPLLVVENWACTQALQGAASLSQHAQCSDSGIYVAQ